MKKKSTQFKWLVTMLLLVTAMAMPEMAWAEITPTKPSSGDGTSANPYQIGTPEELFWFAALVKGDTSVPEVSSANTGACATLTANITVNTGVLKSDGNLADNYSDFTTWTPIGNDQKQYTGTFDGQGHTISGLYFNNINTYYVGLFGYNRGTIKNVGVVDSYFRGYQNVGGVCGYNGGTITGCYNTGKVSGSGNNVGGVCGKNEGGTITGCYNTGTVSGTLYYVGGVCGYNDTEGTITGCYNTGTISGNFSYVGGVCGYNNEGKITGCYSTGSVSGSGNYVGGVCGENDGTITDCYYLANNDDGNGGKTEDQFKSDDVSSLLNTALINAKASVRFYQEGENYPEIINLPSLDKDVYQISNKEELYAFALLVNKNVETSAKAVLTANITVNTDLLTSLNEDGSIKDGNTVETWTPIGNDFYNPYTGIFDGQGHTISGLYFNNSNTSNVGLFVYNSGTIKNVGVVDSYFYGYNYVGGVCGRNGGTITGCYNTGTVRGYQNVGGVCGRNSKGGTIGGTITGCYNTGSVSGTNYVGGVCGENISGTITGCYNTGKVSGSGNYVSGVCGFNNDGTITGCYNTGAVSGSGEYVGGVCGGNGGTITGCYNIGEVSGNSRVGGVCGFNNDGTITGCYYLSGTATGGISSNDVAGSAESKTTTQFASGEVCPLLNTALNNAKASVCFYQGANYPEVIINLPTLDKDVYQISNKEELYAFALLVNNGKSSANAVLTANITVNTDLLTSLNEDGTVKDEKTIETWKPIGYGGYKGTFDGQGYTISGLYFNDSDEIVVGLFKFNKGIIKNVGVVDSYFRGNIIVGGVCGTNDGGTITGCYNIGEVSGYSNVGGVCGYNEGGTITGCYNSGEVSGSGNYVGGVCGDNNEGTITGCYNTGAVSGSGEYVGGVCGGNGGTITGCYNTGTVSGNDWVNGSGYYNVGGVCGGNSGTITGCYNIGTVSGHSNVGGVCGENISGTITGCYNIGTVSGIGYYNVSGVCGRNEGGTITGCYYLENNDDGNGGKTEDQFKSDDVCSLLNEALKNENASVRFYQEGANYPELIMNVPSLDKEVYQISNKEELYAFALLVNKVESSANAVLTANITVNTDLLTSLNEDGTVKDEKTVETWKPIGYGVTYTGTFDGQGHTISGLYFNDSDADYVGLFGGIGGNSNRGTIKNVGVVDSYFYGNKYVSGVCGGNGGTITGCYNTGTVSGNDWVGAVCGYNTGAITGCNNTGKVSGSGNYVGGVCGENISGTITGCYNTGEVSGSGNYVGGVCGENISGTINGCNNTGKVSGNQYVGGVCGDNYRGTITGCYNTGTVSGSGEYVGGVCGENVNGGTITGCYNTGTVSGKVSNVGGVCGDNRATITGCYNTGTVSGNQYVGGVCGDNYRGTITGCYNTGSVSGKVSNVGGVCGDNTGTVSNCYYDNVKCTIKGINGSDVSGQAEGKSTTQFQSGEVCYLLSQGSTVSDGENNTYYSGSVWGQQLSTDNYPVFGDYKVIKAAKGNNNTYWATFSNQSSDMDLSDLTVYTAKVSEGILTLTPCSDNIVAKGEGVLVKGNSEYLNAKARNEKIAYAEANNDLVATPAEPTVINATTDHVLYRLTYNNVSTKEGLGFYLGVVKDSDGKVTSNNGSQLKATPGKAYLKVAKSPSGPAPMQGFVIGEDDNTTGIDVITINGIDINGSKVDDSVYDLMGRKVSKPAKGIYIKNGKKVIIK